MKHNHSFLLLEVTSIANLQNRNLSRLQVYFVIKVPYSHSPVLLKVYFLLLSDVVIDEMMDDVKVKTRSFLSNIGILIMP